MTRGLVPVDMTLVYHAVDNRDGGLVGLCRSSLVLCLDSIEYFSYVGAQHGSLTGILQPLFYGLARALFC